MRMLFHGHASKVVSRLVVGTVLLLFCTNLSEAQVGAEMQLGPFLPVSSTVVTKENTAGLPETGANFLIELIPLWYLFSPDIDGFEASRTGGFLAVSEEIVGWGSLLPCARAGVRMNTPDVDIDLTGGGGYLWNNAVSAPFLMGDVALHFELGKDTTLGPHIGVVSFDELDWSEDADIDFSDSTGFVAGILLTKGEEDTKFFVAIDYINAEFDVDRVGSEWTTNRNTLDISGVAVQVGLILQF